MSVTGGLFGRAKWATHVEYTKNKDQGDTDGRKYTYKEDDQVILEGNLAIKNQKANKVFSIVQEIGAVPVIVFGNSSGDLAMGEYAVQHGGKAYMLLCDDLERDYGNLQVAQDFNNSCAELGFETISMKNDFETIYGDNVIKTESAEEQTPADIDKAA